MQWIKSTPNGGEETLRSGASGYERPWGMKRARVSNRFTTKWDELLKVKASLNE